jgi:DNA-binding transcriptional MerR regulator
MSIGDVLTLLRQEFPDVTISKIRFLESQGLVNPERTPSGYRKFYEHDVERLRWVLRQQREHFLPLKVIKDRLDDDSTAAAPEGSSNRTATPVVAAPPSPAPASGPGTDDVRHAPKPVLVGRHGTADAVTAGEAGPPDEPAPAVAGDGPTLPGIESVTSRPRSTGAARMSATTASGNSPRSWNPPAGSSASSAPTARRAGATPPDPISPVGVADSGSPRRPSPAATGAEPAPVAGTARPPAAEGGAPASTGALGPADANGAGDGAHDAPGAASPGGAGAAAAATSTALSGVSLSAEELSSACGLDVAVIRELVEYGLLCPSIVGGAEYFDEESLAVGSVAAGFARFGIEPRHLRLYKNAADRESGFVEQIVLPLVRQRNPEARARAHETADELTALGQQLRGSLLRTSLKGLLES